MKRLKYIVILFALAMIFILGAVAGAPEIVGDAAVRAEKPIGLRVKASIDSQTASDNRTGEYGIIATRKVFLSGNRLTNYDLTLDCDIYFTKGVAKGYVGGENVDLFLEKNDTELLFAAYIHGIDPYYYTDTIVLRPYVQTEYGTEYGRPVEVSLYGTAKKIYDNKELYNSLSEEQKHVIYSIIVAVDGEPYIINRADFRIVLSSVVIRNANPTYSVSYNLFNPLTGEIENRVVGRKKSKDYAEIEAMLLESGRTVPVFDGVVQDTTQGYADFDLNNEAPMWISSCDTCNAVMTLVSYDAALMCKDCVSEHVLSAERKTVNVTQSTPVYIFDGSFDSAIQKTDMASVEEKAPSLMCYNYLNNEVCFSEYIKALVSVNEDGNCEYIFVIVNGNENAALDEKCLKHTEFDVSFYVDGELYDTKSVLYGKTPELPANPEKDGYTFLGWSDGQNTGIVSPESIPVTKDTEYHAVFEKIPEYTVSFIVDEKVYDSVIVREGKTPELPISPEKDGYTFLGWSDGQNAGIVFPESIPVTKDTEYHAVFTINVYAVTFYVKGEIYQASTVEHGKAPSEPLAPEIYGNKFLGWATDENSGAEGVVTLSELCITGDTDIYAVFEALQNDPNLIAILTRGQAQLKKLRITQNSKNDIARDLIVECITYVLADANNGIYISEQYIRTQYPELSKSIRDAIKVDMTKEERSAFVNLLTNERNIDKEVQDFLIDYFNIDLSSVTA
ncbi:MAG: InlB B-repeat-containing protein [Clostridia bacterium]|nr:InlB B-repeat-containing protein [Clostridia bacterium]